MSNDFGEMLTLEISVEAININMKEFKSTYLYIKKCNVTGLKYFGKTKV